MADALEGKPLPRLALESTQGPVNLPGDWRGAWTVLYTYPKDDTPGCTKEACSFRDSHADLKEAGIRVVGVSLDDLDSHRAFVEKYTLNFPLLADTGHQLTEALGSYGDQEFQGKIFKGLSRDTFLIDPEGIIRKVWRKVSPTTTLAETYEEWERLQ